MGTSIIYGAGAMGETLFPRIRECITGELCFADSNPAVWGKTLLGKPIINPEEIMSMEYDRIIITSLTGFKTIPEKLVSTLGVPLEKIDTSYIEELYERTSGTRIRFLRRYAEMVKTNELDGSVAEGGVFEGHFAKHINAEFPNSRLYLFDTFAGFDERDVAVEHGEARNRAKHFNAMTTEEKVLASMPHPENVEIRKGYFPETATGISDQFVFVNLDFDLYQPTLAGLEFFFPKMARGGVILVHDYFQDFIIQDKNLTFQGVKKAVDEFCEEYALFPLPIGDEMSVAIIA